MRLLLLALVIPSWLFCQPYVVQQVPYSVRAYNGSMVFFGDDAATGTIPIGFQFCFWGNAYTQCYIGSNGWISFSAGQSLTFTPLSVPSTSPNIPRNCIMGPFHDMNPAIAGSPPTIIQYVYFRTEGIAPFRRFVVSWVNVPMYLCTALRSEQQIVLHETTNIIENTIVKKSVCLNWVNGNAIHALHNANGTAAIVVLNRNANVWYVTPPNSETWLFIPMECCFLDGWIEGN